jgi:CheY-like chemotaxis protein
MQNFHAIILIDDDPINNLINRKLISKLDINQRIEVFLEAEKALAHIAKLKTSEKSLIFLDINMPVMNGWDFLHEYVKKFEGREDKIVMLSSSIDYQDRQKAQKQPCVEAFIEKPLTPDKLKKLL